MKKFNIIATSLFLTIFATACEAPAEDATNKETTNNTEINETQPETKTKKVEVFTIGNETPETTIGIPLTKKIGSVGSAQKIMVKAETGGKLDGFAVKEGEQITKDSPLAILGRSLQADITELTYLNALTSVQNAEDQLKAKHEANIKNVANAQIAIEQAEIQLQNAYQTKENINRTSQLQVNNLEEQGYGSFSNITEHLRDVVYTARASLRQTTLNNNYGSNNLEDRINRLEDGTNNLFYGKADPQEIRYLLNESEVILSELKSYLDEYDYQPFSTYDNRYYNSAPEYNTGFYTRYNNDSGSYQVIYENGNYYPSTNNSTSNNSSNNTETNTGTTQPQTDINATLITNINRLLPTIQADQGSMLQVKQGLSTTYDSSITQNSNADTQINLAQTQLKNAQQLYDMRIDQVQLEEQNLATQIDQLKGQLAIAGRNRDTRTIKAPIEGTLLKTLVEPGELINPGQTIAEIGNLDALEVKVAITQIEAAKLNENQPVIITTSLQEELPGFISQLPTSFDPQTKTGEVEIIFDHKSATNKIQPGTIVSVQILPPRTQNIDTKTGIWIPLKSIYFQKDTIVFLNKDGKVTEQIVTTGKIEGNFIEIKSGLKKGDQVITTRYGIQANDKVEIQN